MLKIKPVKILFLMSPTILALALVAAHWISKKEQSSEAEREAPIHKSFAIEVEDGLTTLTVDEAAQAHSGIQTAALAEAQAANGPAVYGTVIDLQPLFDLATRYAAGATDLRAAQAELAQREAELRRVQALYDDKQNVSRKALDAARADVEASKAKASVAQIAVKAAGTALGQQFGPRVAAWTMAPASSELAALTNRTAVLMRVVLPSQIEAAPQRLMLAGDARAPLEARLVSASPQMDPAMQGQAYLYRVDALLAAGARLAGRIGIQQRAGVQIPGEAVVWYGGQPWAYVRKSAKEFERRPIVQATPVGGAFVALNGFKAGEAVVVQGAQLLLSEETRALLSSD
jgi:membrane fusion protein, multidrug efflux system